MLIVADGGELPTCPETTPGPDAECVAPAVALTPGLDPVETDTDEELPPRLAVAEAPLPVTDGAELSDDLDTEVLPVETDAEVPPVFTDADVEPVLTVAPVPVPDDTDTAPVETDAEVPPTFTDVLPDPTLPDVFVPGAADADVPPVPTETVVPPTDTPAETPGTELVVLPALLEVPVPLDDVEVDTLVEATFDAHTWTEVAGRLTPVETPHDDANATSVAATTGVTSTISTPSERVRAVRLSSFLEKLR